MLGGIRATFAKSARIRITGIRSAWSREVKPGQTYAARFAGDPIVLVRPADGTAVRAGGPLRAPAGAALESASMAARIRCCYHGWRYDASGRCVDVSPISARASCRTACRRLSLLRTRRPHLRLAGHGAGRRSAHAVSVPRPTPPTRRGASASTSQCHYSFMHENLMDMNHQFLHRRTTGKVVPRLSRQPLWRRAGWKSTTALRGPARSRRSAKPSSSATCAAAASGRHAT